MFTSKSEFAYDWYLLPVAFVVFFISCGEKTPANIEAIPADPFVGDWHGNVSFENSPGDSLAVQIIGYEDYTYQANIGTRFDTRDPYLIVMEGKGDGKSIQFAGERDGLRWQGNLEGEQFSGTLTGTSKGTFLLRKIIRKPPTLDQPPPEDAIMLFSGQSMTQWEHPRDPVGYINLSRFVGGENRVAYLRTRIKSESNQEAMIEAGSDDGIKIWWNGIEVLAKNVNRGASPASDKVIIQMETGWNTILVKINNGEGGWGAYIRLRDAKGRPLEGVNAEDPDNPDQYDPYFSAKTLNFVTRWQLAGPYRIENTEGEALLDHSFAPEQSEPVDISWRTIDPEKVDYSPNWTLKDGAMQVKPGSGNLISRQKFNDAFIHVEFRLPYMPPAREQKRGNSGVYIQGRYEIQVLDSYGLEGKDNECGGIYKVSRPRVNMCAPPLQWQTYDIQFSAPTCGPGETKISNARITVRHNGVLIHENLELSGITGGSVDDHTNEPGGLMLQDHGDLVAYRNIWVIPQENR